MTTARKDRATRDSTQAARAHDREPRLQRSVRHQIFVRGANVLAVGDVASPVRDPKLDYLTGAWLGGRVDAMDRLLKLSDDKTRIVPGYGP